MSETHDDVKPYRVIVMLYKLANYYRHLKEPYKALAFDRAAHQLTTLGTSFSSPSSVEGQPRIGKGTMRRIKEVWETNKLKELPVLQPREGFTLEDIAGLGVTERIRLVKKYQIKTPDDLQLQKDEIYLSSGARVGLKYVYTNSPQKMATLIPHNDITVVETWLKKWSSHHSDIKGTLVTLCGSYRREESYSRGILVVIANPSKDPSGSHLLTSFVSHLTSDKFLIDHVTHRVPKLRSKYMGFCKSLTSNNVVYRIEIHHVPIRSFPTSVLYYTGSGEFTRFIRHQAKLQKYMLNEYGLWNRNSGDMVVINDEHELFSTLKIPFIPTHLR
jgi:DNA polymerase/3'-5' exonuclease PolX